ncbi:MAG TPA: BON domain-containing protein [Gemmatimonadaceae bacterium]|nr:BON domain-containing protein [Gemmatimonadaceae bacterium]
MAADRNIETGHASGGRSGNDYLQRGGAGYQSWGAEGPSGTVASGGLGNGGAQNTGARSFPELAAGAVTPPASETRRPSGPTLGALLAGAGIGAALMYFLDPNRGARRRHVFADKALSVARDIQRGVRDTTMASRHRAAGKLAELRAQMGDEDVSDERLVARVRAELGHHVERARPIEVAAEEGVVTLRGPVQEAEVSDVIAAVGKVRGVQRVENLLVVQPHVDSAPPMQA